LWIKFFVLAVFATMYVRDHSRPAFYKAIGLPPDDYDFRVFRLCSEISEQTFPVTLDLDHPAFKAGLERLFHIAQAMEAAEAKGGLWGAVKKVACAGAAAATFARLYLIPGKRHALPAEIRLEPIW
jgi:magnesium-protoporphyrin IX monomethyl ester (oxidative) cyclase